MKSLRYLLATCAVFALAQPATAQTAATPPATTTPDSGVQEIIVTATRSPSKESKTPISMEVYTGGALAEKGIASVTALANADSSININTGGGQPFIAVRGVSSSDTSEVGDPAVPVAVDGLFTNRTYAINTGMFDINRVEVLRGPQGTLFGRNVVGGLINIITNDPTTQFGGYTDLGYGNYNAVNLDAAVNVPLTDTLQIRVSGETRSHDGYRNVFVSSINQTEKAENEDIKAGRIKLAWAPTSQIKIGASYSHSYVNQTGVTEQLENFVGVPTTTQTTGAVTTIVPQGTTGPGIATGNLLNRNVQFSGDPSNFSLPYLPVEQITEDTLHWNGSYDFGAATLSYLGGYDKLSRNRVTPQSVGTPSDKFSNAGFVQDESAKTINQELRLSSAPAGKLTWQIGAFYFKEQEALDTNLYFNYQTAAQARFLTFDYPSVRSESIAGYGQATYAVTPTVKLTGGVRWTDDVKTEVGGSNVLDLKAYAPFLPTIVTPAGGHSASKVWTYHAGIDWQAAPSTLVYAHADKGYKAGGFNTGDANPYSPEILYAYELGAKTRQFDNHVTLNVALFYQDYNNQQVFDSVDPLTHNGATSDVINAGKSHIYGLEVGLIAATPQAGRLDLNLTAQHARYVNFQPLDQALDGGTLFPNGNNLAGKTLPNAPDLTVTAGYEYPISALGGTVTPRVDGKYQSKDYFTFYNTPDGTQNGYVVANASLRFDSAGKKYSVELFVHNLGNKTIINDFVENKDSAVYGWGFAPPRTYGARLHVNF